TAIVRTGDFSPAHVENSFVASQPRRNHNGLKSLNLLFRPASEETEGRLEGRGRSAVHFRFASMHPTNLMIVIPAKAGTRGRQSPGSKLLVSGSRCARPE